MTRRTAAALAALALTTGCHPPEAKRPATAEVQPVIVAVAAVKEQPLRRTIAASGSLNGTEDVTLSPKVDGRVLSAAYDLGDSAVPGAVLLALDPTDYQKAVAMERQSLEMELARLNLTKLPGAGFKVEEVPDVQRAETARATAAASYELVRDLTGSNQEKVDKAGAVRLAEANKKLAVTQAHATVAAARMRAESLAMAEQKLADCQLRVPEPPAWGGWAAVVGPVPAPFRYTVAAKMVSEGEMARSFPGTNAYRLVITHTLKLKLSVPEKHTPDVKVGQAVEVRVEAYPDEVFSGTVARIGPTVDPTTRTFAVEVNVPNAVGRLKPGGFAKAEIVVGTAPAVTVPPTAVVVFAGVSKVYVSDGGKARAVLVEAGDRGPDWLEVKGDLKAGEQVITSGFTQLFDGAPISNR